MWQATLLSWAFVEDMNCPKSSQRSPSHAIGLIWDSLWSRISWENDKFEQFQFILIIFEVYVTGNTARLGFCGGYRLRWVFPTPIYYWFDLWTTLSRMPWERMLKVRGKIQNTTSQTCIFFTFFLCSFSDLIFILGLVLFRTHIFSRQ